MNETVGKWAADGDEARGRPLAAAVPRRGAGQGRHGRHRRRHRRAATSSSGATRRATPCWRRSPTSCRSSGRRTGGRRRARRYAADTHVPVLIYPNPLNPKKYVVLNSGFTFREYDYLNNARQVPKLPDYAVIDVTTPGDLAGAGQGRRGRVLRRELAVEEVNRGERRRGRPASNGRDAAPIALREHVHRLERPAEHVLARHAEPLVQDRPRTPGGSRSRCFRLPISSFVRLGCSPTGAGLHLAADQEHRGRRAVVGAPLPFSLARRPNSEKVITSSRSLCPRAARSL